MKKNSCRLILKGKCVLGRSICFLCPYFIREIDGITEMKDYLTFVLSKNTARKAFIISVLSLIISIILLALQVPDKWKQNKETSAVLTADVDVVLDKESILKENIIDDINEYE